MMTKINILIALVLVICLYSCTSSEIKENVVVNTPIDTEFEKRKIIAVLDSLNSFAAKADFNNYFNLYAEHGVFTGTDATERWDKQAFMIWAKPIFDKGSAWNFSALERHIYFDETGNTAWFDELLNTQMKICRGSGVLTKQDSTWKIEQYILSTTIPNDQIDAIVKTKAPIEDELINKLSIK